MIRSTMILVAFASPAAAQTPTWEKDILPLVRTHCLECHGEKAKKNQLDLTSLESMIKGGKTGAAIRPGSLRESIFWQFVATDKMPARETKLTDAEKDTLRRWIVAGAPRDDAAIAKKTEPGTSSEPLTKRGVAVMAKRIDDEIGAKLKEEKIPASPLADDAEFLRRVHLDIIGKIPTYERTVAFLESTDPKKREKLVDELLGNSDYGKHFATIWHKLLIAETAESYRNLHHARFKDWMAESFNKGRGWNEIVRDMLTSDGTVPNFNPNKADKPKDTDRPEGAYLYSFMLDKRIQPKLIAANASRLFLGQSIECAQCHNHPQAKWRRSDFWGVAAFFDRIRVEGKDRLLREPSSAKEYVYEKKGADRRYVVPAIQPKPVIDMEDGTEVRTGKFVPAKFLDGDLLNPETPGPFRPVFATWATASENPFFARAAVNRWWGHLMTRGFVEPVDDMSEDNLASHPRLLDDLSREFAASGFDLKHLIRCICLSDAYQRSSIPLKENVADKTLFSHQTPRQMTAEVLYDSLSVIVPDFAVATAGKTKSFDEAKFRKEFLVVLDSGDGSPAEFSRGLQQALRLMNGDGKAFAPTSLKGSLKDGGSVDENVERIYLTVLNRRPLPAERDRMRQYVGPQASAERLADVVWALLNSSEFIINH